MHIVHLGGYPRKRWEESGDEKEIRKRRAVRGCNNEQMTTVGNKGSVSLEGLGE